MTEKNIFVYKVFLSLNILEFSLFFIKKLRPPPPPLHDVTVEEMLKS